MPEIAAEASAGKRLSRASSCVLNSELLPLHLGTTGARFRTWWLGKVPLPCFAWESRVPGAVCGMSFDHTCEGVFPGSLSVRLSASATLGHCHFAGSFEIRNVSPPTLFFPEIISAVLSTFESSPFFL